MTSDDLIRNQRFLIDAINIALKQYDVKKGKRSGRMSRTQAYLKYGVANVRYWEKIGAVISVKGDAKNSVIWYDELQLDTAKSAHQ